MSRPDFDLLNPSFYGDDPHGAYTWMRTNEPVFRDRINNLWAVTQHADLQKVERQSDLFASGKGYRSFWSPEETNMIALDDPEHAAQRGLVSRRFTPKAVRDHEPWMRATTQSLVEELVASASGSAAGIEVVDAIGAQLPCRLTARLLGWDEERWEDIKRWSENLMRYDRILIEPEAMMAMATTIMEFSGDLAEMSEQRRGCPVDDLVSVWANCDLDGQPYDPARMVNETGLVISGGAETTRTVITRGLRTFCDHPDQWELLHTDPSLIPSAVEELIRWITPLHNFFRTVTRSTTIGDQEVEEHDRVILLYPSANRDEAVFVDPFRFDVTRNPNPHLGFGNGTHFCLGASLARLELAVFLEELVPRITDLHVVDEVVDEPHVFAWAAKSFQLGFNAR